jgi:hypothetical protein
MSSEKPAAKSLQVESLQVESLQVESLQEEASCQSPLEQLCKEQYPKRKIRAITKARN